MARTRVRDARPLPVVCLSRSDLAVLGERVEPRRLAPVRSCYLGLLELAGEPDGWTRGQLAERAGMGPALLRECLVTLEKSGLVRTLEDGSLQLSAPSGAGMLPIVVEAELTELKVVPREPDELDERARGFCRWHAERIGRQTGKPPAITPASLACARRILKTEPDSARIKARIEWALTEAFYADKTVSLAAVERWWQRICVTFDTRQGRQDMPQTGSEWRAVSYDSDRVRVA